MFPEELSIWINRLNKEDHPPQYARASPNLSRAWIEQKVRGAASVLAWLELGHASSPALGHQCSSLSGLQAHSEAYTSTSRPRRSPLTPPFLGLWIGLELYRWFSSASSLQTADCGTSPSPWSCKPLPYSESSYLLLVPRLLWGTSANTGKSFSRGSWMKKVYQSDHWIGRGSKLIFQAIQPAFPWKRHGANIGSQCSELLENNENESYWTRTKIPSFSCLSQCQHIVTFPSW